MNLFFNCRKKAAALTRHSNAGPIAARDRDNRFVFARRRLNEHAAGVNFMGSSEGRKEEASER